MVISFVVLKKEEFENFMDWKKKQKDLKKLCSKYLPVDPDFPTFTLLSFSEDFTDEVLKKIILYNAFKNDRYRESGSTD